jgi:hypothetical protein
MTFEVLENLVIHKRLGADGRLAAWPRPATVSAFGEGEGVGAAVKTTTPYLVAPGSQDARPGKWRTKKSKTTAAVLLFAAWPRPAAVSVFGRGRGSAPP